MSPGCVQCEVSDRIKTQKQTNQETPSLLRDSHLQIKSVSWKEEVHLWDYLFHCKA